jgi:L-lactate dehydrogenase complex protein LldG
MWENQRKFSDFETIIYKVLFDKFTRLALRRAVSSFRSARDNAIKAFPYVVEERKLLQETKDSVINNLDYWVEKVIKALSRSGVNSYFANTHEDALKIIKDIVGTDKLVVKAKSLTTEELGLNESLEAWGNEVYETDLGEFIVQQLHSRPMHITAPAINIPREKVAELFSKLAGKELTPDIPKLTSFAREFLRDKFISADVGISGANAITADTGSIFLIENEGNIRFVTNAPATHIVILGIDKILPTLRDGARLIEVLPRYTGYLAMSYVSIISSTSKTGDIEKQIVHGVHGPKELHVILLDAGRRELVKDPISKQVLRCIRCGVCLYECPIYQLTTGYWGYKYMGGIGIPLTAYIAGGLENAAPLAFLCTLCGRCKVFCPMEIDIPEIVLKIRKILYKKNLMPFNLRAASLAQVNEKLCSGCGICLSVCPFDNLELVVKNGKKVAETDLAACMSCGMCISACPSEAIQSLSFDSTQMFNVINSLIK